MQWHTVLFWVVLVLVTFYAMWRGGSPERVAALLFGFAALASVVMRHDWISRYSVVEAGVFVVDLALLIGLVALALAADRFWPMTCAALQAISTASHLARWMDPEASRTAYMLVGTLSGTPSLLILAGGIFRHRRRVDASGTDNSWRRWSGRSRKTPPGSRRG